MPKRAAIVAALIFFSLNLIAQPVIHPDKVGIEVGGDLMFVDVAKTLRPWAQPPSCSVADIPTDAQFWPTSDACTVLFDNRPVAAWLGPSQIDDPDQYQPDWGGTYKLALTGQATLSMSSDSTGTSIANQQYDAATNTTTADLIVAHSAGLAILSLTNTKRTAASPAGSGFTGLRVLRPGFALDTDQVFTPQFLDTLAPFQALRFMGITGTNNANPLDYNLPVAQNSLAWTDRIVPADATQQSYGLPGRRAGLAWEYVIQIANLTGKDLWINVPVAATDDYVTQLAQLLQSTLHSDAKIYIEHSNEVWNTAFPQYTWNKTAAIAEVAAGGSVLNKDGATDQEVWAQRRHAKRLIEIGNIFQSVFGAGQFLTRIRPVYASWTLDLGGAYFEAVLSWVQNNYGPPSQYFYAIAKAGYFGNDTDLANETVDALVTGYQNSSNASAQGETANFASLASTYGVKLFGYEGGPGYDSSGNTTNIANRIQSARDPRMQSIVLNHLATNWYPVGGDLFMYFAHSGSVSRYGEWGAIEDVGNPLKVSSPKYLGLLQLTAANAKPGTAATVSAANGYLTAVAPDSLASSYGTGLASATLPALSVPLPSRLGATSVAVTDSAGVTRLAQLLFVSQAQVNFLVPADSAAGTGSVTIYNGLGLPVTGALTIQNVAPALISANGSGAGPAAGQVEYADHTIVDLSVPVQFGTHGGSPVLILYGTGVRKHNGAATCTVGVVPAVVVYSGAQGGFAGLDQINVELPASLAGRGDVAVTVTVDGQTSNAVHVVVN